MTPVQREAAWRALEIQLRDTPRSKYLMGCRAFLAAHPEAYDDFERITLEVMATGLTHFSADLILQRMRWVQEVERAGRYLVNNNYRTLLARLFVIYNPQHAAVFDFREAKALSATPAADSEPAVA